MMRRLPFTIAMAAAAFVLGGCAAVHVSSHRAHDVDFSKYRTFDWGTADALPVSDPRLLDDALYPSLVEHAVEREFARRGFERSTLRPDLFVHYHAVVTRRLDVDRFDWERGYGPPYQSVGISVYESGTLVLDVVDARTNRVVWRGWAEHTADVLRDPNLTTKTVDEAVTRMLARFPWRTR